LPTLLPHFAHVELNTKVLGFSVLLSLATGVIFGGLPAVQISRADLMGALRESSRGMTTSLSRQRMHSAFVVVQVALAVVLLSSSALLMNSLMRLNLVRPGLDPRGLITFQTPFPRSLYRQTGSDPKGGLQVEYRPEFNRLGEAIRTRLAQVPGVESAALAMTPPMGGEPHRLNFAREGHPLTDQEREAWSAEWYPVSADYFHALRVPIMKGREFSDADRDTGRPVAIVNATLARRFFPGEDPIGRKIQIDQTYDLPREIVGVAGDVRQNRYGYEPQAQMYVPRAQLPAKADMTLSLDIQTGTYVIRAAAGDPAALIPSLRNAVAEISPSQTVMNVLTVEQYAAGQLNDLRHYAALLSIFGGLSVLLSVVGLSGIMAHGVSQRRNEIGVRVALGAGARAVLGLIAGQGLALTGIGILLGLAASLILTRLLAGFLWGVTATDPLTFACVVAAMSLVALCACYIPARRALRIDPVVALRSE
jgi:putative ABC transport system permease protein